MASEILTLGQHDNMPKKTDQEKSITGNADVRKVRISCQDFSLRFPGKSEEGVGRPSTQMELGGRRNKEPSRAENDSETKRGDYVVVDSVVVVVGDLH